MLWFSSECMQAARGPAWMSSNFDPSYVYLLNSLLLSEGRSPGHTDHPGTPVQVFGALGLLALHPMSSTAERAETVLASPEAHHRTLVHMATIVAAFAWLAAGWVFWRTSGSLLVAVACQAMPLAFNQTYFALGLLTPELIFMTLAAWLGVVATFVAKQPTTSDWKLVIATGLFIATSVMTKINWLPIAGVIVLISISWKARAWTLVVAVLALGAWMIPILPELIRTFEWLTRLITHTGQYGGGPSGVPEWSSLRANIWTLWRSEAMHPWLALIALLGLLAPLLRAENRWLSRTPGWRPLALLLLGGFGVILAASKSPAAHYILPLAAASPAIAFLAIDSLGSIPGQGGIWVSRATAVLLLFITVILNSRALPRWETLYAESRQKAAAIEQICRHHPGDRIVRYYRESSLPYALEFGNGYTRGYYSRTLNRLHPDSVFFNIFNAKFEVFGGWVEPAVFFATLKPALFIGSTALDPASTNSPFPRPPPGWQMNRIEAPSGVFVYRLIPFGGS